jgi:hypothetical protein
MSWPFRAHRVRRLMTMGREGLHEPADLFDDETVDRHPDAAARRDERLDEVEEESFPASDPHSDWAGPGSRKEQP